MLRVSPRSAQWLFSVVLLAVATTGCQRLARRAESPTPLPTYDAAPTESVTPTMPAPTSVPELSPIPPLPGESADIPPVPPSTAQRLKFDGPFGFTAPVRGDVELTGDEVKGRADDESAPQLPTLPGIAEETESTGPTSDSTGDNVAEVTEPAVPLVVPFPTPNKPRSGAPVELDPSLFLVELFESAMLEAPAEQSVPTTVNGLTIDPQQFDWQSTRISRDPPMWPADGVPPLPVITPGPVRSKWTPEPLPTRPANSRPRRLMLENSDSAIRAIE